MSDIAPISRSSIPVLGANAPVGGDAAGQTQAVPTGDSAEFSSTAQFLSKLAELPEIRQDLVDRVKTQIALGTYESPDKFDIAIDELIDSGDLD